MRRREAALALVALGLGAVSSRAPAQQARSDRPARVAILDDAPQATRASFWVTFRRRLSELGYAEGKNVVIEQRWAGGNLERVPALLDELIARNPDVLVVVTTQVAIAARKATSIIPIVAIGPADPVKSGLVASLARPGGNLTGVSPNQAEIACKWVELAREVVPRAKALAYLTDTANSGEMLVFRALEACARSAGLGAEAMDGLDSGRVAQAFATMERKPPDVLVVATTATLLGHRQQIVDSAARLRIPAIYARPEYAEAGGLLSYGADTGPMMTRAADYVQQILKGARPSEMPFEMASTFRLVVNLRAARALGLDIPRTVVIRADEVIRD
jgi:putative tryptophan/tyrosine transport system substrate-binding protein